MTSLLFCCLVVKPYFVSDPDDLTALSGEDVKLKCDVSGDPKPSVVWHREDGNLPITGRISINNGHLLLISGVTTADEGVYICEAQNSVGTISSSVSLAVHGKNLLIYTFFKTIPGEVELYLNF